jgi:SAM-dependent methyltransferase
MQSDPVDAAAFDLAVSQFGVMFFDEPDRAFANVRSHLRPGGRLVFAAWQAVERNPWHTGTALAGLVAAPPAPGPGKRATGPFTLGDTGYTERLLAGAGFVDISWKLVDTSVDAPASAVVDRSLFDFMGVPAERMGEAGAAIDRHLAPFEVGPDVYRFPLAFHIFSARNL